MKKTLCVFAAVLAGFAMVACNNDDNGDTPKKPNINYVMPTEVAITSESGECTMNYVMTDGKISKVTLSTMEYDYEQDKLVAASVVYNVTYGANTCLVKFQNEGDAMTATFTLDKAGYAESATIGYDDSEQFSSTAVFTYNNNGLLTKIMEGGSPLYSAVYKSFDLKTFVSGYLGESQIDYKTAAPKVLSTAAIDPFYVTALFAMAGSKYLNLPQIAVFCNLLPQPYYLASGISMEAPSEDGGVEVTELPIACDVDASGKLNQYNMSDIVIVDYKY